MIKDKNSNDTSSTSWKVPILAATFASSGAAVNLLQQQLYYAGAGDSSLLILIVPTFVGMIIGGLVSKDTRRELFYATLSKKDVDFGIRFQEGTSAETSLVRLPQISYSELIFRMKQTSWVSVTDVTSLTLRSWAQNLCGSGMFTVIYASLPAFNGILSYLFLGRVLTKQQWLSMFVVIIGLAFSAEAEEEEILEEGASSKKDKALKHVLFGIALGIAGTFFSSASYIAAEKVLKSTNSPRYPTTLTAVNGINDLVLASPWLLLYSIPHRQDLLYEPVTEKGQSPYYLIFLWWCLVFSNAAHLNACYSLLQVTESVTLTMLQGTYQYLCVCWIPQSCIFFLLSLTPFLCFCLCTFFLSTIFFNSYS
jgi:hypothetical protein